MSGGEKIHNMRNQKCSKVLELLLGNLFGTLQNAKTYTENLNNLADKIPFLKGTPNLKSCHCEISRVNEYAKQLGTTAKLHSNDDRVFSILLNFDKDVSLVILDNWVVSCENSW